MSVLTNNTIGEAKRKILLDRFEKFTSDIYYTDVNFKSKVYPERRPIDDVLYYSVPELARIPFSDLNSNLFKPLNERSNRTFGPSWSTHWFLLNITVPDEWAGKSVHLIWNSSSEALIFNMKGVPLQGLTGGDGGDKRHEFPLISKAFGGDKYSFYIEMACNGLFGIGGATMISEPDKDRTFELKKCEIAVFDEEAYELLMDFKLIADMAAHLPQDSNRGSQALLTANKIINKCDTRDRSTWGDASKIAKSFLNQHNGDSQHTIYSTGHCHIDVAWLWPYDETKRKCARSWSSQLSIMNKFKDYKFSQSQAQLYEWTKQLYPELYEQIKQKVQEGQFVPVGGSWVEMDGILPSGESMARQFLYGQRFFKKEFGKYCTEFWLPDSFGYSGQLPQIMKLSNIDSFVTQKMSWNNINKFPHSTMHWQGLDGSRVWAHFPPMDNYCSQVHVKDMLFNVSNFKQRGASNISLCLFGFGDGGGGPNYDMLERLTRFEKNIDSVPIAKLSSAKDFFDRLKKEQSGPDHQLEVWHGELYFELHRGCYTSQASTKRGNRFCQVALRNVEILNLMSRSDDLDLSEEWKLLLLNQFHDVLPGSSIGLAYVDAIDYYRTITKNCEDHISTFTNQIKSTCDGNVDLNHLHDHVLTINTCSWDRSQVVEYALPNDSNHNVAQISHDGKALSFVKVQQLGYDFDSQKLCPDQIQLTSTSDFIQIKNQFVRLQINQQSGHINLFDYRMNRWVIENGGNEFQLFEDVPLFWDAWDVEVYHVDKPIRIHDPNVKLEILESGPLRACVKLQIQLTQNSRLTQFIKVHANSSRIDFHTLVDWNHEQHVMLKSKFPTTIYSPHQMASFDAQFGHLQRPTHRNTSWDWSKFEVHCQMWFDLSEFDFGLAILNDCKHGCSVLNNEMSISLLRSPKSPDVNCDMGHHEFTYSLYSHEGNLQSGNVIQEAYQLNYPLICKTASGNSYGKDSLFDLSAHSVVIDAVKRAEDDRRSVVVRLYESFGGRVDHVVLGVSKLILGQVKRVCRVNILEEELEELEFQDQHVDLGVFGAFQIQSIKFEFE
ncbi:alpha-mannosidase [Acrasis kona]|uniref:alpha-mannosidase n=1 Tax=Acrasis kona TaxID=1008807 RepID=A0AAW2ZB64_9EUKA